jgi:hypothetical protein
MKLSVRIAGALVAATLAVGLGRAQEPPPTPTPTPDVTPEATATETPPAEPTPEPVVSAPLAPAPPPAPSPNPAAPPAPAPASAAAPSAPAPPPAAPAPPPPAPAVPPARVIDSPRVAILQAPGENPFGLTVEAPAALPLKLTFADAVANSTAYVAARVDPTGRIMGVREQRDPIPSLSGETQRSLARWVFDPARKGSAPVETWAAMRLDLQVAIGAPRSVQGTLTPVTPATPVPRPFVWLPDDAWLETRKGPPPDGGVPLESVDSPPMPKKTPWDADSYKGPFSAKFWVKVNAAGVLEKLIPLEVSDPVLVPYLRRAVSGWAFQPARANGGSADSWNELQLNGQIVYRVELKQIASLRRPLFGS